MRALAQQVGVVGGQQGGIVGRHVESWKGSWRKERNKKAGFRTTVSAESHWRTQRPVELAR